MRHIQPIHANIKEPQFDVEWFQSFDIVLNAFNNFDDQSAFRLACCVTCRGLDTR